MIREILKLLRSVDPQRAMLLLVFLTGVAFEIANRPTPGAHLVAIALAKLISDASKK